MPALGSIAAARQRDAAAVGDVLRSGRLRHGHALVPGLLGRELQHRPPLGQRQLGERDRERRRTGRGLRPSRLTDGRRTTGAPRRRTQPATSPDGRARAASSYDTTPPGSPTLGTPADASRVNSREVDRDLRRRRRDRQRHDRLPALQRTHVLERSRPTARPRAASRTARAGAGRRAAVADAATLLLARARRRPCGNQSAWTATRSFMLDTNPPGTPSLGGPADGSYLGAGAGARRDLLEQRQRRQRHDRRSRSAPTHAAAAVVHERLVRERPRRRREAAAGRRAGSPTASYYWRAQAQDAAGNQSAWSAVRELHARHDAAVRPVRLGPADGLLLDRRPLSTSSYTDPTTGGDSGTLVFEVCATNACTTRLRQHHVAGLHQNDAARAGRRRVSATARTTGASAPRTRPATCLPGRPSAASGSTPRRRPRRRSSPRRACTCTPLRSSARS